MNVTAAQLAAQLSGGRPPKPRCRACPERLDQILVDREDNTGLHMGCEEPPVPAPAVDQPTLPYCSDCDHDTHRCPGCGVPVPHDHPICPECDRRTSAPPPSTVGELRQVLMDYDASRPRSLQTSLGPSELGTPCQAQIARKLAGAPRRPVTAPAWAPFQGTAVHAEMEKVVAFWNAQLGRDRWIAEDDLQIDAEIGGHGDAYDLDHDMVVDWKYVGTTALKNLRAARRAGKPPAEQVSAEYRTQAHLYGVGHERKDRTPKFVRLVLLARGWQYDDSDEWTEEWQPDVAFMAIDRYYATKELLAAFDVARNPGAIVLVASAPSEHACAWCPFHDPTRPSSWDSCQGHTAKAERAVSRQLEGLIP